MSAADLCRAGVIAGGNGDGSIQACLAHVLGAEMIWYSRWQGSGLTWLPGARDYPTLDVLEEAWAALEARRADWLTRVSGAWLAQDLRYLSIARQAEEVFPAGETLLHASNHTSHHRGELCCGLTALGHPPESVDLLDYMRASRGG